MTNDMAASLIGIAALGILATLAGLFVFYWIVRLAVRHGIRDTQPDPFDTVRRGG